MSRGPDIGTALCRAIARAAAAAGCPIVIVDADWQRWASATFSGARHRISFSAAPSAGADQWIGGLGDTEIEVRGHLVADLDVVSVERRGASTIVTIDALTVAER